ncbi:MAG: flagellar basal body P-ring formation chaperone FlgA [Pseudomonadota bacterium]
MRMIFLKRYIQFFFVLFVANLFFGQISLREGVAFEGSSPGQEVIILINENSFVNHEQVLLGQISHIEANDFLKQALEKVSLGNSPKPDKIRAFSKAKIIAMIQSQKYLPENTIIKSPDRIYVKRLSQVVSKQDVQKFVNQSLFEYFPNKDFELIDFDVRGLKVYPQGKVVFRADPADMVDTKGRLSFFLDLLIDGKKVDRATVKGSVAIYEDVLHTSKPFKKGEAIPREDLYVEKKNIFDLDSDYTSNFQTIDKKILKTGIKKGDYLKASLLCEPFLVKKGDMVTLVARNENLLILTTGICKEDGFENNLVRVENLNSGELVRGIVKDKSRVEVVY